MRSAGLCVLHVMRYTGELVISVLVRMRPGVPLGPKT